MAAAGSPVPLKLAVACPPETLPYTVSKPPRVPVAVGRKRTCTAQVAFCAIVIPVQLSVSLKSPVVVTLLTIKAAFPVFVTVNVTYALAVPTCCSKNVTEVGLIAIAGIAGEVAVSNGICQIPRPYVAARSSPVRPSPVGIAAAACSSITGEFGSDIP